MIRRLIYQSTLVWSLIVCLAGSGLLALAGSTQEYLLGWILGPPLALLSGFKGLLAVLIVVLVGIFAWVDRSIRVALWNLILLVPLSWSIYMGALLIGHDARLYAIVLVVPMIFVSSITWRYLPRYRGAFLLLTLTVLTCSLVHRGGGVIWELSLGEGPDRCEDILRQPGIEALATPAMGIPPEGKFYDAFLEEASGLLLVVSSWSDPALYLVNTRTHKVLPLPAPGGYAGALEMTAYDPVTRTVDVTSNCALWQPRPCPDVYTVSFAERRITQMTDIPEANRVAGILRSGEDEFLTDDGGSRILHVSGKDKKVVGEASWPASNEVWKMALDPSKGLLYTSSSYFGWKLSEVDVRTHRIARERWIGPVNTDVAFQEGYIYAARPMAGMVDVYDQRTFERVRRLPTLFGTREIDLRGDVLAAGSFFQARGVLVNVRTGKTEINVKLGGPVRGVQRVGDKSAIFCSRCGVLKVTAPGT